MQYIKKTLRSSYKPFEQCVNRMHEREQNFLTNNSNRISTQPLKLNNANNCFRLKSGDFVVICKKMKEILFIENLKSAMSIIQTLV